MLIISMEGENNMSVIDVSLMTLIFSGVIYILYRTFKKSKGGCVSCSSGCKCDNSIHK